ncbi:glutamate ABC transporter substrate-binding protein [Corynebacterium fournieri]|uniref:glutamate ABC transporter substrate-binding protein n=1 Tax=Corynebacterium fournieri TaxID=1852390 RepID=UPI000A2F208B|nr:glutamate ABC transporter substrate-binding protein [Corynebacterium fournieri]WJY98346.1 ABC transporter glutamine-binding protein GlnH precursor [Corynebacterium fournieri]
MRAKTIACLAAAGILAGCADAADPVRAPIEPQPETSTTRELLPLPPGAKLEDASGVPDDPFVPTKLDWEGSLNPRVQEEQTPNLDRIKRRGRLVVGIDQSLYLLAFRDTASGELRGLEVDLARAIAHDIFGEDDSGTNRLDLRFVDSAARAEALNNGEVDLVIRTMSITPERAASIAFSTPYLTSRVRVLVPRDRGVSDINQLADKTVCIVDGTNLTQIAHTYAPHSKVLRTRSWSDCLMATQQFQADAIVADDSILAGLSAQDPYAEILPGTLASQYYGVGMPTGQSDLVRQVNATLERMRNDGTWSDLYSTWLGGSIAESAPPPLMYRKEEP